MDILMGHLWGDYVVQNDWMARNKTSRTLPCLVHCLLYTLSVWLWCCDWITPLGLLLCFAIHFPIDRWRLASWWMNNVSGQKQFAAGPLSPWSIIIVDNIFHLATLMIIKTM